jgi:hypothetical protein
MGSSNKTNFHDRVAAVDKAVRIVQEGLRAEDIHPSHVREQTL